MFFIINTLTLLRFPLAFLFLYDDLNIRIISLVLAMSSDVLDGYLARQYKLTSRFGAIVDPLMDKFFVFFVSLVLVFEAKMSWFTLSFFLSRDIFLLGLGILVTFIPLKGNLEWQSRKWGKCTTVFQFVVLILLLCGVYIPIYVYIPFLGLGYLTVHGSYHPFSSLKSNGRSN